MNYQVAAKRAVRNFLKEESEATGSKYKLLTIEFEQPYINEDSKVVNMNTEIYFKDPDFGASVEEMIFVYNIDEDELYDENYDEIY